jgi:hypothetical protein
VAGFLLILSSRRIQRMRRQNGRGRGKLERLARALTNTSGPAATTSRCSRSLRGRM